MLLNTTSPLAVERLIKINRFKRITASNPTFTMEYSTERDGNVFLYKDGVLIEETGPWPPREDFD